MSSNGNDQVFGATAIALTMVVNLTFALNVTAMKVMVSATAPFTSVSLRMGIVFLLCLPWFRLPKGRILMLAAYGALNGGFFLLVMSLALNMATHVGALAIAGQLSVPFALLLSAVAFGERLTLHRMLGVLLAFGGVVLLVFDPKIVGEIPAVLTMSAAAFIWACGTLFQRKLGDVSLLTTQAWNGFMGAILLLPLALWTETETWSTLPHMGGIAMGWFAFSCIGATIVGQGMLAWLLQRYSVSTVMPLTLVSPVIATLFASVYFHNPITPIMIGGGLIAVAGVAVISLAPPAKLPPLSEAD